MSSRTEHFFCDSLLSEKEVAGWLNINPKRLQAWRLRSYGPEFVRISSKCVRYSRESIQQWLSMQSLNNVGGKNMS